MNFTLHFILCGVLIAATVGVGLYRKWLEDHCGNYLHLHGGSNASTLIDTQSNVCKKLSVLDKVRTALIAAVVVYVVAIAGFATYDAWIRSGLQ